MKFFQNLNNTWLLGRKTRAVSLIFLFLLMIIGSIYSSVVLPEHEKWIGLLALFCGFSLLTIILLMLKRGFVQEYPESLRSYFYEFILLFSLLAFLLLNLLLAVSSYMYGNSRVGVVILSFSLAVFAFHQWKHRYLFLFSLLVLGGLVIELGVG